ncbi:glutamate--tRNA ligase MSE1 KNAG_0L00620 [Huiozyma naganishii CBS 8797]|uniref:Glutamate--tRNA ligase, mitochondrial n=1 Tax=Huiozyma naganishii (strain ATCC MYA-139 / BCRC 22969 / CBS 8797 / KCTC 17520 / NBRC 10181 / NCYC 3082 / Yp74L-3) TaxID=1071383 RepID=J7RCT5_HUIN7|nr:hypothetical protein KNAG_0L00620 [Kazachstania naganishii CBS 8797]CCK72685.1 hypothetical protein KNAG_0L00620 [Kazachstania naganishii CBS 8797]
MLQLGGFVWSLRPHIRRYTAAARPTLVSSQLRVDIHPVAPVVTRFAPSPTGLLHLGSLRTALYNYLLAKNTGGKFILRLEDTDRKRYHAEAEQNILDTLDWCHIKWDGPMYRQSDRAREGLYTRYAEQLVKGGFAYKCFCSKERLNNLREEGYDRHCTHLSDQEVNAFQGTPYVIRFKAPEVYDAVDDLLHGSVRIQPRRDRHGFDDPVLLKSDRFPTYHLANVVDDHLMGVTHVIRGEEWLPSTPKHIAMYKAFGWSAPQYVHIPLLTNVDDDKKLSKRRGDAAVYQLKQSGILPEALLNFVALLGWSPPRELANKTHECFTLDQLVRLFNMNHLTRGNVKVDSKKLWFFNKHFLQERLKNDIELEPLVDRTNKAVADRFRSSDRTKVKRIIRECGTALNSIDEFCDTFHYFFEKPVYTSETAGKFLADNSNREVTTQLLHYLQEALRGNEMSLGEAVSDASQRFTVKKRTVFETLRFALAGSLPGAKIPVLVSILGPNETAARLQEAAAVVKNSY